MTMRSRRWQTSLSVLIVAVITTVAARTMPAHARGEGDRSLDTALALNRRSSDLYRQGRYGEAIALLREAYRLNPDPILQYNLARSCEQLGDYVCAIDAYETYLAAAEPSDRVSVEARLARCRARLAARRPVTPVSSSATPLPTPPTTAARAWLRDPSRPRQPPRNVLPLVVTGAGLSAVAGGLGLVMAARSTHDAAVSDPSHTGAARKNDRAESLMRAGNITLVAGTAVAAAGILWWAVEGRSGRSAAPEPGRTTIRVGVGYLGLSRAF